MSVVVEVEHDHLEHVAGAIWSEHECPHGYVVVARVGDHERVSHRVLRVVGVDAVLARRSMELHTPQSYYRTLRVATTGTCRLTSCSSTDSTATQGVPSLRSRGARRFTVNHSLGRPERARVKVVPGWSRVPVVGVTVSHPSYQVVRFSTWRSIINRSGSGRAMSRSTVAGPSRSCGRLDRVGTVVRVVRSVTWRTPEVSAPNGGLSWG